VEHNGWLSASASYVALRAGDKIEVSQQSYPAPLSSTYNRLGDERQPESGWLIGLTERKYGSA